MSLWLKQLPVKCIPQIGDRGEMLSYFPDWAAFMIWCGWWLRATITDDKRMIMLLVVPERACCSALSGLGALIASTQCYQPEMEWEEFLSLPSVSEIYLKDSGKNISGILGDTGEFYGEFGRIVTPLKKSRKHKDSRIYVLKNNYKIKEISLIPYFNQHHLMKISKFYSSVVDHFEKAWLSSITNQCRILTNKTQWYQNIENIALRVKDNDSTSLCDFNWLLFTKAGGLRDSSKISVISPKAINKIQIKVPLTIYDGPDTLAAGITNIRKTANALFLLTAEEYDTYCYNQISLLSQNRCDTAVYFPHGTPEPIPDGIERTLFALPLAEDI